MPRRVIMKPKKPWTARARRGSSQGALQSVPDALVERSKTTLIKPYPITAFDTRAWMNKDAIEKHPE
jgi:hypothetical protein